MEISIVGSGYVGTTVAACFADLGHTVMTIDIDEQIVDQLNHGKAPIHEPELDELINIYGGNQLTATTDYAAVRDTDITFLALPTPSNADGSIDTSAIEASARTLGEALAAKDGSHQVVVKSTVVPGTTEDVLYPLLNEAADKETDQQIDVAMNPEFLSQGTAVTDFQTPDKIVFGTQTDRATQLLTDVFEPLIAESSPAVVETGIREAEMIKYANNAFLATKISLINELGNLCKEYGVDAYEVATAIGLDDRIGKQFLRSGVGWGGSCFPKDTRALIAAADEVNYEPSLLEAAVEVNEKQPKRLLDLLEKHVDVSDRQIAVLGLAFKSGTDDIRGSRAVPTIEGLQERNADIVAYDPVAIEHMRETFPDIDYAESAAAALNGAHGAVVVTDWDEFSALDAEFDQMTTPVVVDGRRVITRQDDIIYEGITW
ncbi:UDP-glucose 6-dehydrogenase AglM [Halocatena pleomorpha]|uniref:UDP-glucose 6-dehydrogenase n=1 Tax=Halocatena pleomorpha TaxID=1785090 RepID=A0A3P3RF40_9EURY|nr:UDP-glucose 6-dehydrogenase AglM [Halocatena pleomorpha]RRJ31380.1 UDP-glucose/GDP-mannose dehydrogenase family protein [Halocatena pleomorpha]